MASVSDAKIAESCVSANYRQAAALVIDAYGGEIMRFLVRRANDEQVASEAFATFCEDLCRGLPHFEFRCSVRTWLYTMAYHALAKVWRCLRRDHARVAALCDSGSENVALAERTETPTYLQSGVQQQLLALRQSLSVSDQLLLDLRVVQCFSWKEVACILLNDRNASSASVDKQAARLRKRFQILKTLLRARAQAQGLLSALSA